jgi:hypothetical protein
LERSAQKHRGLETASDLRTGTTALLTAFRNDVVMSIRRKSIALAGLATTLSCVEEFVLKAVGDEIY